MDTSELNWLTVVSNHPPWRVAAPSIFHHLLCFVVTRRGGWWGAAGAQRPSSKTPELRTLAQLSGGAHVEIFGDADDPNRAMAAPLSWTHALPHGRAVPPPRAPHREDKNLPFVFQTQMQLQEKLRDKLFVDATEAAAAAAELALSAAAPNAAVLALELQSAVEWTAANVHTARRRALELNTPFVPVEELLFDLRELYAEDFYQPKAAVVEEFKQELNVARRMTVELEDTGMQKAVMSSLDKQIEAQRMKGEAQRSRAADEQASRNNAGRGKQLTGQMPARLLPWTAALKEIKRKHNSNSATDLSMHFATPEQKLLRRKRRWEKLRVQHEQEVDKEFQAHQMELQLLVHACETAATPRHASVKRSLTNR
jgi:hypothetical protein